VSPDLKQQRPKDGVRLAVVTMGTGSLHLSSPVFVLSLVTLLCLQEVNPGLWRWGWASFQTQQHWGAGQASKGS
jgi:hypothetical protein